MDYSFDIAFVILNYCTYKETLDCVGSIRSNIDTERYIIIIIDNQSKDGSYQKLLNTFDGEKNIICVQNEENLGFAKGNNAGIDIAVQKKAKFICAINSDILLEQKNFYETLLEEYEKSHSAVIGPQIIKNDGSIQVTENYLRSVKDYQKMVEDLRSELDTSFKKKIKRRIKSSKLYMSFVSRKTSLSKAQNESRRPSHSIGNVNIENVILHGCFLIFTPEFFTRMTGFDDSTFMFGEEEILYFNIIANGLKSLYCPKLTVKHLEDVSVNYCYADIESKRKFTCENRIVSYQILIDKMLNAPDEVLSKAFGTNE